MTATAEKEVIGFQAEVKQLMHLMIHSLYSNKEIFLRELISNASDAADKLRFAALSNDKLLATDPELKIFIDFDREAKTITIKDTGIGMTRTEVINNLGTIAKSGTKEFLQSLTGEQSKDSKLIGQFGVGFYSSFIVAEEVTVVTRKADAAADEAVKWVSKGDGEYSIEYVTKESRGTEITLRLKDSEDEFLNSWKLRNIIKKYSDHITIPVKMYKDEPIDPDATDDEEKTNEVVIPEEEVVNRATALWTLPKSEIKDEQYIELYKGSFNDMEEPLLHSHNKVEGKHEYTSLLYIPGRAPFDLWHQNKSRGLKLYVQRVFIMDEVEQFLPQYLRFVRGIVDSSDLPLNVSREILQDSKIIDNMRSALTKRILGMLENLAKNESAKYKKFWNEFGKVLKEGPVEDFTNKEKIANLLRFSSTHDDSERQEVTLEDYIARMKSGQEKIYYVTADTFNAAKNSPHLEVFRKQGIEVLLLSDRVDEWLMTNIGQYSKKSFQSVAKGSLDLGDLEDKISEEDQKKIEDDYAETIKTARKVLKKKVKEVRTTNRLTSSPACVVADENGMGSQMEKIMRAAGQNVPDSRPIFEINPEHVIIKKLKSEVENRERFDELVTLLFEQATLAEGGQLDDPASFVKRLNELLIEMANIK